MSKIGANCHVVDINGLPEKFPTHGHDGQFWESLGRAVATFSFLEEVLGKAIFAFTATRPYEESEIENAYKLWLKKLQNAISDPLGRLITSYGEAVRNHPSATIPKNKLEDLLQELRKAAEIRNILCHGSWGQPDSKGASVALFVSQKKEINETSMDVKYINQVQRATANLACMVINTVTHMGLQFPGLGGPGEPIGKITIL
jgi:hypothetical protein